MMTYNIQLAIYVSGSRGTHFSYYLHMVGEKQANWRTRYGLRTKAVKGDNLLAQTADKRAITNKDAPIHLQDNNAMNVENNILTFYTCTFNRLVQFFKEQFQLAKMYKTFCI